MTWDPEQYIKFSDYRLRAGYDLLAQVPMNAYQTIYDLGCGTGELTQLLQRYWVDARVVGIDESAEMLAKAKSKASPVVWEQLDIRQWQPEKPADLIFANALLQWLPHHQPLLLRLLDFLKPGGVLAFQMSNNFHQPSHRQLLLVARSGPWRSYLEPILPQNPVLEPEKYFSLLAPHTSMQNIWQTTYLHPLAGADPVVEWMKGTFLKPLLDVLPETERQQFLTEYTARIREAYPPNAKGETLFPFRRLFVVVQKNAE